LPTWKIALLPTLIRWPGFYRTIAILRYQYRQYRGLLSVIGGIGRLYSAEHRSDLRIFMLPRRDANAYRTLIALYLSTSQAPIRGLVIGSLVRVL